jgi:hypothetical protein
MKEEISRGLDQVWERLFATHRDVSLDLAWIALAIDRPRQALRFAEESGRMFGKSALTLSVLALAHAMLKDNATALKFADRALALQPDNAAAKQLKATLTAGASATSGAR